jgi:hypothetical protein
MRQSYRRPSKYASPTEHPCPDEYVVGSPATCDDCRDRLHANRARVYHTPPVVGVVPGGANDTKEHRFHMDFDKGMYAYEKARKEGLRPPTSDLRGVARAHAQVKSHEAALRDSKKAGIEFHPDVKVAAGVDKEKYIR